MSDFNKIRQKAYSKTLFYCKNCKTPLFANREKDIPTFCPVCHINTKWEYADNQDITKWNEGEKP